MNESGHGVMEEFEPGTRGWVGCHFHRALTMGIWTVGFVSQRGQEQRSCDF